MTDSTDRTSAGIALEPGEPTYMEFMAKYHPEELKTTMRWYYSFLMRRRFVKRNERRAP